MRMHRPLFLAISIFLVGQHVSSGGSEQPRRMGSLRDVFPLASGLVRHFAGERHPSEPDGDDDDNVYGNPLDRDSSLGGWEACDDDDDGKTEPVETKEEEIESPMSMEVMALGAACVIDNQIASMFSLYDDVELSQLACCSSDSMRERVSRELERREIIRFLLNQPEHFESQQWHVRHAIVAAIKTALIEWELAPECHAYLFGKIIGTGNEDGFVDDSNSDVKRSAQWALLEILRSWKDCPSRVSQEDLERIIAKLTRKKTKGKRTFRTCATDAYVLCIGELLSNRRFFIYGRIGQQERSELLEALTDNSILKKHNSLGSGCSERALVGALESVLKSRLFCEGEETLLLSTLFGADGDGGFASPDTHTYTLESVAWAIREIYPYYDEAVRAMLLNALVGKHGFGGILRHVDKTKSDAFAQMAALEVIAELLKSMDPSPGERKRLISALNSINEDSAFLNEPCMQRVRRHILWLADTYKRELAPHMKDAKT